MIKAATVLIGALIGNEKGKRHNLQEGNASNMENLCCFVKNLVVCPIIVVI